MTLNYSYNFFVPQKLPAWSRVQHSGSGGTTALFR